MFAALTVLGLLVFGQVVLFDSVNVDDPLYLDSPLKGAGFRASLRGALTDLSSNLWHPLTRLSFFLEWRLFGAGSMAVHHATNLVLHLVAGFLVQACLRELGQSRTTAFLVAALFLIHPVQSEAVAWISSRKGVLGSAFLLGATLLFLRNVRRPSRRQTIGIHLLLMGSLLSTPVGVVAPAVFFLVYLLKKSGNSDEVAGLPWRRGLRLSSPYLIYSGAIALIAVQVQAQGGHAGAMDAREPGMVPLDALARLGLFFGKAVVPEGLTYHYARPGEVWWLAAVGGGLLLFSALMFVRSFPLRRASMAVALFVVFLLPSLGLVYVSGSFIATRYLTLAVIPLAALLVIPFSARRGGLFFCAVVVAAFAVWTAVETSYWRNDARLFSEAVKRQPGSSETQMNYANHLLAEGEPRRARAHYRLAREIAGDDAEILYNLALLEFQEGNPGEAKELLEACRGSTGANPKILYYLATVSLGLGEEPESILPLAEEYHRLEPERFRSVLLLGELYLRAGRTGEFAKLSGRVFSDERISQSDKVLFRRMMARVRQSS